jgi:hypothetical protein
MVKQTEHQKMIALGEWLESMFYVNLNPVSLMRLAREGLTLCSIVDFDVKQDDPVLNCLSSLDLFKYDPEKVDTDSIIKKDARIILVKYLLDKKFSTHDKADSWLNRVSSTVSLSWQIRNLSFSIFKEIHHSNISFEDLLAAEPVEGDVDQNHVNLMFSHYNQVRRELGHENGTLVFVNNIAPQWSVHYGLPLYLNVPALISRVFLDFFLKGGQQYFGYCANCRRFMIVHRKGRKRSCSDLCRTILSQKSRQ